MATVELMNVCKRFGKVDAVSGVSLLIADREFVAFVGPSGCGKSTLLRMIAGLEELSEGEILIDGRPAQDVPPAKRGLAMVFQSYALYPHMTVEENMSFSLRLAGVARAEREAKVRAVARILEMEPLLERKPRELSGGQLQRVAIGRAMVRQPKAFLLDEPLSNLDAALQAQMRLELRRLQRDLQATMIYVTHDQVEAMTMADRIVVLNQGRVEQVATPMELYDHPATLFVAGFIGAPKMNFFAARVAAVHIGVAQLTLAHGGTLDVDCPGLQVGAELTLGVRPERVLITPDGDWHGEIQALEHLGSRTYVHARLDAGGTLVAQAAGDTQLQEGGRLAFRLPETGCHLFDSNGKALGGGNR